MEYALNSVIHSNTAKHSRFRHGFLRPRRKVFCRPFPDGVHVDLPIDACGSPLRDKFPRTRHRILFHLLAENLHVGLARSPLDHGFLRTRRQDCVHLRADDLSVALAILLSKQSQVADEGSVSISHRISFVFMFHHFFQGSLLGRNHEG